MKNIFNWANGRPTKRSEHPSEDGSDDSVPPEDIPIPEIYGECDPEEPTIPDLRIIGGSSESDSEGFDPYDTAVLEKK